MNAPIYREEPRKSKPWSYLKEGCAAEYRLERLRELPVETPLVDTAERAYAFHCEHVQTAQWYDQEKEAVVALFLNARRMICGFALIALGGLSEVVIYPREVFRPAIIHGTSAIVLMHNHPAGDPSPSEADVKITRDMIRAGQLLKIEVLDHVIVGRTCPSRSKPYASLLELGFFYR